MKKHLSVLTLAARGSIYKMLLLLLITAGAETAAFYFSMKSVLSHEVPTLEAALTQSRIHWICAAAFLVLTGLLMIHTGASSTKTGYTLSRLSVSERGFVLWQTVWHTICYAFFWAMQLLLIFVFCLWYVRSAPAELVGAQNIFLAFHRVPFLFNLMPMGYTFRWVRNALLLMATAFAAACFSYRQRRGKISLSATILAMETIFFFRTSMTDSSADATALLFMGGIVAVAAYNFFKEEDVSDETVLS